MGVVAVHPLMGSDIGTRPIFFIIFNPHQNANTLHHIVGLVINAPKENAPLNTEHYIQNSRKKLNCPKLGDSEITNCMWRQFECKHLWL